MAQFANFGCTHRGQLVKILHPDSLIATVDAFNEAVFFGRPWQDEAEALAEWCAGRLGKPGGYAGSFAMTEGDWGREFRLFTGERITTGAARTHIIAEETTRMLALIRAGAGIESDALKLSEERLGSRVYGRKSSALENGVFCCGKCSVSVWRCVAAGGFKGFPRILHHAPATLFASRDGIGDWRRFPFYYTLLLLVEADRKLAGPEISYCQPRLRRSRQLLEGKRDRYSIRRAAILDRALVLKKEALNRFKANQDI